MRDIKKIILIVILILLVILAVILSTIIVVKENISDEHNGNQVNELTENRVYNDTQNNVQSNTNNLTPNIMEDEELEEIIYDKALVVTNPTYFYTIENCIKDYLNNVKDLQQDTNDKNREIIYNQLSERYIQNNKIELNNVEKYVTIKENISFITIVQMVQLQVENNGIIRFGLRALLADGKNVEYLNFIVYLDYWNLTYSIEPVSADIADINQMDLSWEIKTITENTDNRFTYEVMTTDKLIDNYFKLFTDVCFSMPELAYEYLNDECKREKFKNIEDFKEYVFINKNKLEDIKIEKYSIVESNEGNRYICVDQYGFNYIIEEVGIMQFKLTLDSKL